MERVIIRYTDLPLAVGGFTSVDENGDYNMYINSRWGRSGQSKAKLHEWGHIVSGDFTSDRAIAEVERN